MSAELKTPKGTRDYGPEEMAVREWVFATITRVFKLHGAVTIDTPVFELKEVLTSKYGEDSKLIYDLQDQGGELCALRYDLTVPFARYLAMNLGAGTMKRYHVGKVYRRDQPVMTRGRFREFYQCDFDIAGAGLVPLLPDAEVFKVVADALRALDVGTFRIKVNSRLILDGLFAFCGVPETHFRAACAAVDKLDKLPWADVRREMVADKGVPPEAADRVGTYVVGRSGGLDLIEALLRDPLAEASERARRGLEDLRALWGLLGEMGIGDVCVFDTSLARGLDYYTGVIYEAVLVPGPGDDAATEYGSIAGGGRYDNLVGMFTRSNTQIPCVGASIGVERVFAILEARARAGRGPSALRPSPVQVFVAAVGADASRPLVVERLRVLNALWAAGISAEMSQKAGKLKALDQFAHCERAGIPYAVIVAPDEADRGVAKIRCVAERTEETVPLDDVVSRLRILTNASALAALSL